MTKRTGRWCVLAAVAALLVVGANPALSGNHDEEEFGVAEMFFELNDTDGDLGLHALIDGDPWQELEIEDPRGREMLEVEVRGRLRRQGLTELFFESAEPNFDELDPEDFFRRFPAGEYEVEGETLDRRELESTTELTHVIPAPPGNVTINGIGAGPPAWEEECDEENPPQVMGPEVVIEWDAVTDSHPELGVPAGPDFEILRYQAVAEWEDDDENVFVSSVDIKPEDGVVRYGVTVSPEFFVDGTEVKFEVLVREASFNQTAVESCPFEYVLP
jgi:hypothetical protein